MQRLCTSCLRHRFERLVQCSVSFSSAVASQTQKINEPGEITMEADRIKQFQHIWKLFDAKPLRTEAHSPTAPIALPPQWFVTFCYEAQQPANAAMEPDDDQIDFQSIERFIRDIKPDHRSPLADAARRAKATRSTEAIDIADENETDPYLSINIQILPEEQYVYKAYTSPTPTALPAELQEKLALGKPEKQYLQIGVAYAFPERMQLPTSWGTEPAKLLIDPAATEPIIYVQLSDFFPPLAWIPVKPSARAIRRVFSEFAQFAAIHHDSHHAKFIKRWENAKQSLVLQKMIPPDALRAYNEINANTDPQSSAITSAILRYVGWMARGVPFHEAPLREFPNSQDFFCGEYEFPEKFMSYLESCPFFFAIPELRTDATEFWGKADGPGVVMSAFRCIYSKAIIWVKAHFSTEVKLPPTEPDLFKKIWHEKTEYPPTYTPVFIRVVWPDNVKMCGGGGLIRCMNERLGTEFARDMPIDAAMALVYATAWAGRQGDLLGVVKMRQRLQQWEDKVRTGKQEVRREFGAYPGTKELPSPLYTDKERLGMHLQYLAHIGDPEIETTLRRWIDCDSGAIRLGCAKAALEAGKTELFLEIVQRELPGRFRKTMLRCYRSRKKRDVYDKIPRLRDEQFDELQTGELHPVSLDSLSSGALESHVRMHMEKEKEKDL